MNNPTLVEQIDGVILHISDVLYRPWFLPVFLIVGGLIFTFATKFVQVRLFPEAIKVIKEKPKNENGISSFGALMVSTASRVGTGNIIGVSTAICCGTKRPYCLTRWTGPSRPSSLKIWSTLWAVVSWTMSLSTTWSPTTPLLWAM